MRGCCLIFSATPFSPTFGATPEVLNCQKLGVVLKQFRALRAGNKLVPHLFGNPVDASAHLASEKYNLD